MKILFIQPFRYGDILQLQPVLKSLKEKIPDCEIHFVVDDYFEEILDGSNYIDKKIVFPKMKSIANAKYRNNKNAAIKALTLFLARLKNENYDVVINMNFSKSASFICKITNAKRKAGPTIDKYGKNEIHGNWSKYMLFFTGDRRKNGFNLVDLYYAVTEEALDMMKGTLRRLPVFYVARQEAFDSADLFIKENGINRGKIIGIQAGASKKYRTLLNAIYPEVAAGLCDRGFDVVIFGSKGEEKAALEIIKKAGPGKRIFNSCGKFNISGNYALISYLNLFITVDTLNMHLAAAAGVPLLSIFYGEAYHYETGPYASGCYIYTAATDCWPCNNAESCVTKHCIKIIKPENILKTALKIISKEDMMLDNGPEISLYKTNVDELQGYSLELCQENISSKEIAAGMMRMLYGSFWSGLFAGVKQDLNSIVYKIWESYEDQVKSCDDLPGLIRELISKTGQYMDIRQKAEAGLKKIQKNSNVKNTENFIAATDNWFLSENFGQEMLTSYYKVQSGLCNGDLNKKEDLFKVMINGANASLFAISFFLQKINEYSFDKNGELVSI